MNLFLIYAAQLISGCVSISSLSVLGIDTVKVVALIFVYTREFVLIYMCFVCVLECLVLFIIEGIYSPLQNDD